jgi:hypothetical protein
MIMQKLAWQLIWPRLFFYAGPVPVRVSPKEDSQVGSQVQTPAVAVNQLLVRICC